EEMGVQKITSLDENFSNTFANWINKKNTIDFSSNYSTEAIISFLMQRCKQKQESVSPMNYQEFAFN
ncbi:MAG TPA: hypothetical protein VIH86_12315, partial [Puia sp.]